MALDDPSLAEGLIRQAPLDVKGELLPRMVAMAGRETRANLHALSWALRWVRQRVEGWEDAWRALTLTVDAEERS